MLKEKRKLKPNRRKHRLISFALMLFLLLTAIFPPHLFGDLYPYNGLFLGLLGVGIVTYALWGFIVQRICFVAVLLLIATLVWGYIQVTDFGASSRCYILHTIIGNFELGLQFGHCGLFIYPLF